MTSRFRLVVTGTRGQIVRSLLEMKSDSEAEVVALGRPHLDLGDPTTIHAAVVDAAPDVLVNAAAYTNVEQAESEPALAKTINAEAAGVLAASARKLGVPIVHISTDYVFDGRQSDPYRETDPVNPCNNYGRSKAEGELAVAAAHPMHVILRTSWLYSPFGRNFVMTMLDLAKRQEEVKIVSDQIGSPTSAADVATSIVSIAHQIVTGRGQERWGIFHMTAAGSASWAEFAAAIFELSAQRGGPSTRICPITSAEYQAAAQRPPNSQLDCAKIAATYGISLPHWRASLGPCIERILEQRA